MRTWLREARKSKGYTAAVLAEALCISESYYSMIENGLRQVPMDITLAAKLEALLDIPMSQIVQNENAIRR